MDAVMQFMNPLRRWHEDHRDVSVYAVINFGTFWLDLALVAVFIYVFSWPGLLSVAVGFVLKKIVTFYFTYKYVFPRVEQSRLWSFTLFFIIALISLGIIAVSVELITTYSTLSVFVARIIVAIAMVFVSYYLNALFNFKTKRLY